MRNLKKFLALVLAFMMTMSLMVTVNAADDADFSDDVEPVFQESVDVLHNMGVVKGVGDANDAFMGEKTLTRAEAAAIIYRLHSGDVEDKSTKVWISYAEAFPDVTEDAWYAGYIGYCFGNGIIAGYEDGTFQPNRNVKGYEFLAMILRAIGYNKDGEFSGTGWQTRAAQYANANNLLDDVNNSSYKGKSLMVDASREMVTNIAFRAAQVNVYMYFDLFGYRQNTSPLGGSATETQSLGVKNFGLTNVTRIVVGNQATGEKGTLLGTEGGSATYTDGNTNTPATKTYSKYAYPGAELVAKGTGAGQSRDFVVNVPDGIMLDLASDLSLFGHEVNVWYNNKANSGGPGLYETYAATDKAELSAVVKATADSDLDDSTTNNGIGKAAAGAGFKGGSNTVYISASFSRIGTGDDTGVTTGNTDLGGTLTGNTSTVFVLISNNKDKKVDVVIPVVLDVGEISQINNQIKDKTFVVGSASNVGLNTAKKQELVMNPEAIKLGNTVVATKVTQRTNTTTVESVYWLDTLTKTVTGTVVAYDWDGVSNGTQKITLDDGTELKRTIIADTHLMSGNNNAKDNTGTGATKALANAKYEFTVDMQGNWVNAKRIYDNNFIYGTYLDYRTELGSSSYTWRMIGVDMDGKVTSVDFTGWMEGTATTATKLNVTNDPEDLKVPYRTDYASATGVQGRVGAYKYKGYIVSGSTLSNKHADLQTILGMQSLGTDANVAANTDFQADVTIDGSKVRNLITKADLAMGVKKIAKGGGSGSAATDLYLTEHTKFIVVNKDGYGTNSLKPVVYNGLTEFLGSRSSIGIKTGASVDEILYTSSPYVYANTGSSAQQVDVIFIPETELTYSGTSSVYFFHDKTNITDAGGTGAKLYTVYIGGEKTTVWMDSGSAVTIDGEINTAPASVFHYLMETGEKAADGKPIYEVPTTDAVQGVPGTTDAVAYDASTAGAAYKGTTNNGLTALLASDPIGTANAKVVNLTTGYSINDINDLNEVSSLTGVTVTVCVEYAEAGSRQVSTIYVIRIAP